MGLIETPVNQENGPKWREVSEGIWAFGFDDSEDAFLYEVEAGGYAWFQGGRKRTPTCFFEGTLSQAYGVVEKAVQWL